VALIIVIDANVGLATALPLPFCADADRTVAAAVEDAVHLDAPRAVKVLAYAARTSAPEIS
jgi:hypothetical protein